MRAFSVIGYLKNIDIFTGYDNARLESIPNKKSKNKVHYVYIQHSLVSLHMAYREGAFDHYDYILCRSTSY